MDRLPSFFYGLVSIVLTLFALALVVAGPVVLIGAISEGKTFVVALIDSLSYIILSLAVFDVAKYVYDEEVKRGREMRKAAETRRSLTKFMTVIIIAVLMDSLVALSKAGQQELNQLLYPVAVVGAGVALLLGLGLYQRLSATVEEKVGQSDDDDEAEAEAEARKGEV